MKYRSDIDGLRALAILPVVLCHLGVSAFSGGFVGVDVFFVISGFLISRIILDDVAEGRFTLTGFYERRIRRIFPALFAMLMASFALAWWIYPPDELVRFARTFVAALLSYSNFHFNKDTDYFDDVADMNPLLHTWSLGAEEQFYLLFPLLLLVWTRWSGKRAALVGGVVALAVASFAASVVGAQAGETSAFYLLHSRAWELSIGVLLALNVLPAPRSAWLRQLLAAAGLFCILFAVYRYDEAMAFPGYAALLPVLGAAAILYAGQGGVSLVGRLLSLRPVVFIGLVSYSWYLWHWPLIVFFRHSYHPALVPLQPYETPVLLGVSFLLAVLSWRWVERPFRGTGGEVRFPRRRLFALTAICLLAAIGAKVSVQMSRGWPQRFPAGIVERYNTDHLLYERNACLFRHHDIRHFNDGSAQSLSVEKANACLRKGGEHPDLLVIGDSHASSYLPGLRKAFPEVSMSLLAVTSCRTWEVSVDSGEICNGVLHYVVQEYLPAHPHTQVLIIGNWQQVREFNAVEKARSMIARRGVEVQVIGPLPNLHEHLPRLEFYASLYQAPNLPDAYWLPRTGLAAAFLSHAKRYGADYIPVYDLVCPAGKCTRHTPDGHSLFTDKHHLSLSGADYVVRLLKDSGRLRLTPAEREVPSPAPRP